MNNLIQNFYIIGLSPEDFFYINDKLFFMEIKTVKTEKTVFGGNTIAKIDSKTVFIPYSMPDETLSVNIVQHKNDYDNAEILEILEPSPHRVTPACKYYGNCGGCNMMHISTDFQRQIRKEMLCDAIQEKQWKTLAPFHDELLNLLRTYMFVGGMPEVVQKWIDTDDYFEARETQREILRAYAADFSKHAPKEQVPRLNMVWDSLPAQLSKENKKFVYGIIREGARAKDFEIAIEWLCDCGLVLKSHRIKEPRMPLKAYQDQNVFKLFMLDVGLLGASVGLDARTLIDGNKIFTEFKGAMAEQFVMQELTCTSPDYLGYWTNERSTSKVDFVLQKNGAIVPIEVKSGENLSSRSFTLFCDKFKPDLAIKTSMLPFHDNENMLNVPLYGIATVETLTKSGKK